MRTVLPVLMMSLAALGAQVATPDARIEQVPDGKVDQKVYSNEAFEISFRIRDTWTIALTPKGTTLFAPGLSSEDRVNRCSRELFSSEPAHSQSRPFGPKVTYFVFDPECFPGAPFPKSTKDQQAVSAFALRVVNGLSGSPYIPPGGADFGVYDVGKRSFVTLTAGKTVVNPGATATQPLTVHVTTILTLTESSDYWVVMAETLDDEAKKTLQTGGVGVTARP